MADPLAKMKPLPPLTKVAGLGNIFKDAVAAVSEAKASGQALSSEVAAFRADVDTVRQHVRREHEDFHFQMGTLGNGGGSGTEQQSTSDSSASSEAQTTAKDEVGNASIAPDASR